MRATTRAITTTTAVTRHRTAPWAVPRPRSLAIGRLRFRTDAARAAEPEPAVRPG